MADVFISFIHEEQSVAGAIQRFLCKHIGEQNIFLSSDEWQIFAGEVWLDRIKNELEQAKVVILVLSPASVKRAWVNFEAGAAWLTRKVIIPTCFRGLSKAGLPKPYSNFQAGDLPGDASYLVRSVPHHLGLQILAPPPNFGTEELEEAIRCIGVHDK